MTSDEKTELFVQKQPNSSIAMMQQHSKPITTTNTKTSFMTQNKKQKQTLQQSKQQPRAEQKLKI